MRRHLKSYLVVQTDQNMLTSGVRDCQKKQKSVCKGPEKEVNLTCSKNNRNGSITKAKQKRQIVVSNEIEKRSNQVGSGRPFRGLCIFF